METLLLFLVRLCYIAAWLALVDELWIIWREYTEARSLVQLKSVTRMRIYFCIVAAYALAAIHPALFT